MCRDLSLAFIKRKTIEEVYKGRGGKNLLPCTFFEAF
jgi:hypothetical protein